MTKRAKPKRAKSTRAKPARTKPARAKPKRAASKRAAPAKPTSRPIQNPLGDLFSDPGDLDLELFGQVARFEPIDRSERGLVKLDDATVVTGDLIIDGDLEMNGRLVVLGSLRCTGFVFTGIHCSLVVRGDVSARAVEAMRSYWLIGGSITTETAWLSTYGFLKLGGELRARLLVAQQYFDLDGAPNIVTETRIDTDYLPKDAAARAKLDAVLDTTGLVDNEGDFDNWALLRAMSKGANVFRSNSQ
jgi:hypothetical protein